MNQKPSTNRPKSPRNAGPSLFVTVKESITTRQAAELYGLAPDRKGMVCCPFHADKHPSMKVDARFHCFGCGADGDVIDFAARLHGLRPYEAAKKLAEDSGLALPLGELDAKRPERARTLTPISTVLPRCVPAVLPVYQYKQLLERWEREYAPKSPEELLDLRYCEALHKLPYLIQLTGQLSRLSTAGIRRWILNNRAELDEMERRVAAARGGDAQ